uniref:Uncharacterized protein n=1 Tax=Medicago truncatula TaxID=3880 RepID=I3SZN6_MEDTR|nr:unknown [Medicago truncatula]
MYFFCLYLRSKRVYGEFEKKKGLKCNKGARDTWLRNHIILVCLVM